jgi:hypothetical protein
MITSENVVNKKLALRMVHPDSLSYKPSQSQLSSYINKQVKKQNEMFNYLTR